MKRGKKYYTRIFGIVVHKGLLSEFMFSNLFVIAECLKRLNELHPNHEETHYCIDLFEIYIESGNREHFYAFDKQTQLLPKAMHSVLSFRNGNRAHCHNLCRACIYNSCKHISGAYIF